MNLELSIKPNFIIAGAMKSGTSTLHHLLGRHDEVFIPAGETNLFTIDDIEQFPQAQWNGKWVEQNFEEFFETYNAWHSRQYVRASTGQLLGADAPQYLASRIAVERIAKYLPDTKLLILLRDPFARLVSHYWHWVRSGQAVFSLEDTLRFQHGNLFQRSCYQEQLERCFAFVPRENVKIIIFEQFVCEQDQILNEIFNFLNVKPTNSMPFINVHKNPTTYPLNLAVTLTLNRMFRRSFGSQYRMSLPRLAGFSDGKKAVTDRHVRYFRSKMFTNRREPHEKVSESTERHLRKVLLQKNAELPKLLGVELSTYWKTFQPLLSGIDAET